MQKLTIPRTFFTCRSHLELEELPNNAWRTFCDGAHECYGCNGNFMFHSLIHPDKLVQIAKHEAPDVMGERWWKEGLWMTNSDLERVFAQYPEGYFYLRDLFCDLDTVFVYKVKDE